MKGGEEEEEEDDDGGKRGEKKKRKTDRWTKLRLIFLNPGMKEDLIDRRVP